jgi:hypothetical protein
MVEAHEKGPEMVNVEKLFPNLSSLELAGAFHVSNAFVSTLPSSVTHLAVQTIDDVRPPGTPPFFNNEGISELPRFLDSLVLSGYLPWAKEDMLNLPRSLTSLTLVGISNLSDETLLFLPPCLQHLEFSFSKKSTVSINGLKLLPQNLTSLKIKKAENLSADCFGILPPQLTAFEFGGIQIDARQMRSLPRSILSLNLTRVTFDPNATHRKQNVARALPPRLHTLILVMNGQVSDEFAKVLPKSLTHLYITKPANSGSFGNRFMKWLPRSLLSLHATPHGSLTEECVPELPRGLTTLDLGNATSIGTSPRTLAQLPRQLTRLNIKHWPNLDTESIAALPRGLEQLSLLHSQRIQDETLRVLPPTLTSLELRTSPLLTNAGIKFLPKTLRSISLDSSLLLTGDCLVDLPPNVTCLQISTINPVYTPHSRRQETDNWNHPIDPAARGNQAQPNARPKSWWSTIWGWVATPLQ